jgi:hypothetical protein
VGVAFGSSTSTALRAEYEYEGEWSYEGWRFASGCRIWDIRM